MLDPISKRAECKTNREVRKGDLVVTGERGIKIVPQERPREGVDIFQFMSSTSSSERPTQQIAKKVALDIDMVINIIYITFVIWVMLCCLI